MKLLDSVTQYSDKDEQAAALCYVSASMSVQLLKQQWEDAPLNAWRRYALTESASESVDRWVHLCEAQRLARSRFSLR